MKGMDHEAISEISSNVNLPVIASSGAGSLEECVLAVRSGANAVAIGAMFQFTEITPKQVRNYLHEHGIDVRSS
jgi:cyclase